MCMMGKALYGDAVGIRVLGLEADADALMGGGVTSLLAFAVVGRTRSHWYVTVCIGRSMIVQWY